MRELIKQYFQGYSKQGILNALLKFIKSNPEVEKYLNDILVENSNWENIRNIVYSICFDEQLKHCKNCGKELKYSKGINHDYCSHKCSNNSKEVKDKIKQTNLERYGCEHPAQTKKIKDKIKQTNLETYGCENVFQNKGIKDKIKQTCIERYGCENPMQLKEVKEKIKQTNLERYKCKYPLQNKEIQEKYKHTNLEKYGYKNPLQNKEIQEKIKQTCLERFSYENPTQNKEVQNKIKQTNLERYGYECSLQSEKAREKRKNSQYNNSYDNFILSFIQYGITPLFSKEEYEGYDKTYRWKCLNCGTEFESKIYTTGHVKECLYLPHCWNCYPRMSGESRFELEVFNFIKELAPNVRQHDRIIISPQELDIVIDELKLAIELNGDYWHSIEHYLENHDNLDEYYNYHLNKVLEANKKGYRLIHVWENNYEEIKDKLIDILEGKENLTFTEDKIKLDRSFYNSIEIPEYKLIEEIPPETIERSGFNVENCGYLIYERINNFN